MEKVSILIRFLLYGLEIPVLKYNGTDEFIKNFSKNHCFLKSAQPILTETALEMVLNNLHCHTIYKTNDILGINIVLFSFESTTIIVGPWVEEDWDEVKAEKRLAELNLPATYCIPYKIYYCGYRVINEESVMRIISAGITALSPTEPPYMHQQLLPLPIEINDYMFWEEPHDFQRAVKQYEKENLLLKLVEEGYTQGALNIYRTLGLMASNTNYLSSDSRNFIANATILRTLVRKAAENGGVHPAVIDAISQEYAQKIYSAGTAEEVSRLLPMLIEEFCDEVKIARGENYSSSVRKAADYIRLHMSQNIKLEHLAEQVNLSPNYLSHIFKKETKLSVSQYIAQVRCRKAAEMLRHTNLTVQEISTHVGYLDNNYFVKVFKEQYGATPSQYRENLF